MIFSHFKLTDLEKVFKELLFQKIYQATFHSIEMLLEIYKQKTTNIIYKLFILFKIEYNLRCMSDVSILNCINWEFNCTMKYKNFTKFNVSLLFFHLSQKSCMLTVRCTAHSPSSPHYKKNLKTILVQEAPGTFDIRFYHPV